MVAGQDRRRRAPATRRASSAGSSDALLDGDVDLGVHSAKDLPGELPDGLEIVGVAGPRGSRRRLRRGGGLARGGPRGRPHRNREPAPPLAAARAAAGPRDRRAARQRRHPAGASSRPASSTASSSPPPACAGSGATREIAFALRRRGDDPGAGPGRAGARGPSRRRGPGDGGRARSTARPLVELTAERAAVAALDASCHTPVGVLARARRRARCASTASPGCPTAASGCATASSGDAEDPAALGAELAERMLAAGARGRSCERVGGGAR